MTLQKPVIVNQTYYDRCSINNHNKTNLPPHKMMMLGQLVNLLWQIFVKPIIVITMTGNSKLCHSKSRLLW